MLFLQKAPFREMVLKLNEVEEVRWNWGKDGGRWWKMEGRGLLMFRVSSHSRRGEEWSCSTDYSQGRLLQVNGQKILQKVDV